MTKGSYFSTLKTFIANAKDANIIKCALLSIKQYSFWNDDYIFSELAGLDNVANMIFEDTEKNLDIQGSNYCTD